MRVTKQRNTRILRKLYATYNNNNNNIEGKSHSYTLSIGRKQKFKEWDFTATVI